MKGQNRLISYPDNMTLAEQLASVKRDLRNIQNIPDPIEEVQIYVVSKHPYFIDLIENPTEKVQHLAIKGHEELILDIRKPCVSTCQAIAKSVCDNIIIPANESVIEPTKDLMFKIWTSKAIYLNKVVEHPQDSSIDDVIIWHDLELTKIKDCYKAKIEILTLLENKVFIHESSGCKTLISDISGSSGNEEQIGNFWIMDKSTGKTEPLNVGDIDLSKQPAESVKGLLSGKQVEMTNTSGLKQMIGLNKTPAGWGLQIGKQVFSAADTGAEL